jgi:hypothetical protein
MLTLSGYKPNDFLLQYIVLLGKAAQVRVCCRCNKQWDTGNKAALGVSGVERGRRMATWPIGRQCCMTMSRVCTLCPLLVRYRELTTAVHAVCIAETLARAHSHLIELVHWHLRQQ